MRITKAQVVAANAGFASHWSPREQSDNDSDYQRKTERRIWVSTEQDADLITVRFDTALVWAIRDGKPDSDDVLTFLAGLFPLTGPGLGPTDIALNGINALRDADDMVAQIVARQSQPFATSFFVPGTCDHPEAYQLSARIEGYLRTSDTGDAEHACIPEAWAELQAVPSTVEGRYNVGLEDATLARFDFTVPCQTIARDMVSEVNLRGLLKTNGGIISSTISAVGIHTVRFVFKRCAAPAEPRVQPPRDEPKGKADDGSTEGSIGKASKAGEPTGHHDAKAEPHDEASHGAGKSARPAGTTAE